MAEYIDKNATVGILEAMSRSADCECIKKRLEKAAKRVSAIPTADVAPVVHGCIVGSLEDGRYRRRFSCCGEDATMITQWAWPKYCPNCGAKMDGGDNDAAD